MELKFRAFDKHINKMICTGFSIIGEVTVFGGLESFIHETPVEGVTGLERLLNLDITQFTGLKDPTGKEIYAGDVFEDVFTSKNRGVVTFGEYTHCFDDKRLSDFGAHVGFYVKFNVPQPRKDLKYWAKNKEIIGNIYEHAHLIMEDVKPLTCNGCRVTADHVKMCYPLEKPICESCFNKFKAFREKEEAGDKNKED